MRRPIQTFLVICAAALASTGVAVSANPATPFSFHWDVSPTCPLSQSVSSVDFTGTTRTTTDGNGGLHTVIAGKATDENGANYVFSYENDTLGNPLTIADHFVLVGNGALSGVRAGFILRLTPTGHVLFGERGGSFTLECDPF